MQDYPRTIPSTSKVGFTLLEVWVAYSPVKNSPAEALAKARAGNPSHSATTGEMDIYKANCTVLEHLGAKVDKPVQATYNGIQVEVSTRLQGTIMNSSLSLFVCEKKVWCADSALFFSGLSTHRVEPILCLHDGGSLHEDRLRSIRGQRRVHAHFGGRGHPGQESLAPRHAHREGIRRSQGDHPWPRGDERRLGVAGIGRGRGGQRGGEDARLQGGQARG